MNKEPRRELTNEELEKINAGYIVKDDAGYHVIDDTRGDVIHTFQEADYDFMMRLIHQAWKISDEFITWEQANEIRQKHIEEWNSQHP